MTRIRLHLLLALLIVTLQGTLFAQSVVTEENFQNAAAYSASHGGLALRVQEGGRLAYQAYAEGWDENTPHKLYSGTKSFVSYAVWQAIYQDHLISSLNEPACWTLTEWSRDDRRYITIKQLLTQTGGLDTGDDVIYPASDQIAASVNVRQLNRAGSTFRYGPSNYQALGEILRRKLRDRMSVEDYIRRRAISPAGVSVADWKYDPSGQPMLHTGLMLSARQWAKYGEFLKKRIYYIVPMLRGTPANPAYGMGFWLNVPLHVSLAKIRDLQVAVDGDQLYSGGPSDLFAAIGAGKQRLYIIPSLDLVIVRFGDGQHFSDQDFLSRLLTGRPKPDARTH
jgi:CubicO group peptidase (beta-lactamase class C family)